MSPSAPVAPEVTFATIELRLSEEYPVIVMSPRAEVAPLVMLSMASPRDDTLKPVI